ncbi:hypothetical protein J5Y04_05685 [Kitasatospora sp. RG8]|uniref:hypothetical protein n=1 Tax=Kitasatospora sp. RG8 TaxID=2820815 RepID=UPI001AE006F7|nr:hypothetical protein [Kitasatospora sp. RG8]MBP0449034.1 hypothetical protein [Kitasatospora sp. RG8]
MAVLTAAAVFAAPAASAAAGPNADLRGWARLDTTGPVPKDDRLTLLVDAHSRHRPGSTTGSTEARGHATIRHEFPEGGVVNAEIDVDCLITRGSTTALTGTVSSLTITMPPGRPQPTQRDSWHPETAFSFYTDDSGHRRVGWRIPRYDDPTAPPAAARCEVPVRGDADFYLVEGGFTRRR